jgi:hypothetical protein
LGGVTPLSVWWLKRGIRLEAVQEATEVLPL